MHLGTGELVGHDKERVDRPSHARRGADGDKCVHGGGAVRKGLEAVDKVGAVHIEDGEQKHELAEGERHGVRVVGKHCGQWPAEHVAHA